MNRFRSQIVGMLAACLMFHAQQTAQAAPASAAGFCTVVVAGLGFQDDQGFTVEPPGTVTGRGEVDQPEGSGEGTDSRGTDSEPTEIDAYRAVREDALTRMERFLRENEEYTLRAYEDLARSERERLSADPLERAVTEFGDSFSAVRDLLDGDRLEQESLDRVKTLVTVFIRAAGVLSGFSKVGIAKQIITAFLATDAFNLGLTLFQAGGPEELSEEDQAAHEERMQGLQDKLDELQRAEDTLLELKTATE